MQTVELRNEMKDIYTQPKKKARESDEESTGTVSIPTSVNATPRSYDGKYIVLLTLIVRLEVCRYPRDRKEKIKKLIPKVTS
jgi:hypothetical protein